MKIVPNISAPAYTLSATIVGFILIDDLTPAEQNSLGNWFMLVGQVLCSNSAQQQVVNNNQGTTNSTNEHIVNDDYGSNNQIAMLQKAINAMEIEINNLKKNL